MQGTKDSKQLPGVSVFKHLFLSFLLLPALVATPVRGEDSVITLAMVSYDQPPAHKDTVIHNDSTADQPSCTYAPSLQYRIARLQLNPENTIGFSSDFGLQMPHGTLLRDWSQYVYKKSRTDWRTNSWVHVEAGYGQFCQFESCFGANAAEMEQPSCAFLKATFSF